MTNPRRRAELEAEHDAQYRREYGARERHEARFEAIAQRLRDLDIDPHELRDYLAGLDH